MGTTRSRFVAPVVIALALLVTPAAAGAQCRDADTSALAMTLAQFESASVCLVNDERAKRGLSQLSLNGKLASVAADHSSEMRWKSYFAHESADGSPFADRIIATGYTLADNWLVGENIAWGTWLLSTPRAVHGAWMNSPAHRDNILEPTYREIGAGADRGTPSDPYAVAGVIFSHEFGATSANQLSGKKKRKCKKGKRKCKKRRKRDSARRSSETLLQPRPDRCRGRNCRRCHFGRSCFSGRGAHHDPRCGLAGSRRRDRAADPDLRSRWWADGSDWRPDRVRPSGPRARCVAGQAASQQRGRPLDCVHRFAGRSGESAGRRRPATCRQPPRSIPGSRLPGTMSFE